MFVVSPQIKDNVRTKNVRPYKNIAMEVKTSTGVKRNVIQFGRKEDFCVDL